MGRAGDRENFNKFVELWLGIALEKPPDHKFNLNHEEEFLASTFEQKLLKG